MRPTSFARLLAATALAGATLALASAPAGAAVSTCVGATVIPSRANLITVRAATLCLLNEQRPAYGLAPLSVNRSLGKVAGRYSALMVRKRFFDHVSPRGSTLISRVRSATSYLRGSRSWALGENIAWGLGSLGTPAAAVDAWMHSPEHRANILTPGYRNIGIGVATGAPVSSQHMPGATYTTDFGRK